MKDEDTEGREAMAKLMKEKLAEVFKQPAKHRPELTLTLELVKRKFVN